MEAPSGIYFRYKKIIYGTLLSVLFQIFFLLNAYSQVDYYYDSNVRGWRAGVGVGFTALRAVYNATPLEPAAVGSIDFAFSPYLNVGFEGQFGIIKGVDSQGFYYYSSSTDTYMSGSVSVRLGVGYFRDFNSRNKFTDALKRLYLGAGVGLVSTNIKFTYNNNVIPYGPPITSQVIPGFVFDIGTYIDLRNILGSDKLELNPKLQFSYLPNKYFDGFISRAGSQLDGVYDIFSVSLRYKF